MTLIGSAPRRGFKFGGRLSDGESHLMEQDVSVRAVCRDVRTPSRCDMEPNRWTSVFTIDKPSDQFGSFGDPRVTAVGLELDAKLAALLEHLHLQSPRHAGRSVRASYPRTLMCDSLISGCPTTNLTARMIRQGRSGNGRTDTKEAPMAQTVRHFTGAAKTGRAQRPAGAPAPPHLRHGGGCGSFRLASSSRSCSCACSPSTTVRAPRRRTTATQSSSPRSTGGHVHDGIVQSQRSHHRDAQERRQLHQPDPDGHHRRPAGPHPEGP